LSFEGQSSSEIAMLARIAVCALIGAATLAPRAIAQQPNHPFYDPAPVDSRPTPTIDIGRGRVNFQTSAQQERVYKLMPQIEKAIAIQLANPDSAEFKGLRTGRYQKAMIVCGVVDSIAASGETEKRRFMARSTIATLETADNSQAFRAGWKSTGCGF
jgi:hypothetical protein